MCCQDREVSGLIDEDPSISKTILSGLAPTPLTPCQQAALEAGAVLEEALGPEGLSRALAVPAASGGIPVIKDCFGASRFEFLHESDNAQETALEQQTLGPRVREDDDVGVNLR